MKKLMVIMTALLFSNLSFAADIDLTKHNLSSSISMALKSKTAKNISTENDIHIVYGGEDVSARHQLVNA